jgi:hypothetical protein
MPSYINFKKDQFTSSFIKDYPAYSNRSPSSGHTDPSNINNKKNPYDKSPRQKSEKSYI